MEGVIHIVTGIDCHSGREYCQWKGTIHNNIVIGRTCYSGGEHCQWKRTVVICLRVLWSTQNEREHCHCNTVQENKANPKHTQMHILPTILYCVEHGTVLWITETLKTASCMHAKNIKQVQ